MSPQRHSRRLAVIAALLLAAAFLWRGTPIAKFARTAVPGVKPRLASATATTRRKIYPFSVIFGGAHSGEELARARKLDSVVAQHYAGFGDHAVVRSMGRDAFMYVSYRKANQVYWTRTKHRIPKGEQVLSDGANLARTRCGNRLSPKPQAPIATADDPTEEAMDIPDGPKTTLASANLLPEVPEPDFFIPASPADAPSALSLNSPAPPVNGKNLAGDANSEKPYVFPPQPGMGGGPILGSPNYSRLPVTPGANNARTAVAATALAPPENGVVTPEPGTLPLLLVALLLGSALLTRQNRKRAALSSPR